MIPTYYNNLKSLPKALHNIRVDLGLTSNPRINAFLSVQELYNRYYSEGPAAVYDPNNLNIDILPRTLSMLKASGLGAKFAGISLKDRTSSVNRYLSQQDSENNYPNLEAFVDQIYYALSQSNLEYKQYILYVNHDKMVMSLDPHLNWEALYFGTQDDRITYVGNHVVRHRYSVV